MKVDGAPGRVLGETEIQTFGSWREKTGHN